MHIPTTAEALAKFELKQYKEAIADFDKAIELNPKNADIYNNRGNIFWVYIISSNTKKLFADFDKAIELNPKLHVIYKNLWHCKT